MKRTSLQSGFTLIELSIVLVIIGLLAGGVLVGRDLIRQAEIRAQIKQLDEYRLAYGAFRLKYGCAPGDCDHAEQLFDGVLNGNGNGRIENNIADCYDLPLPVHGDTAKWSESPEYSDFFLSLSKSGMVSAASDGSRLLGPGLPLLKLNNAATFFAGDSTNFQCNSNSRNPDMNTFKRGTNALWIVAMKAKTEQFDEMLNWDDHIFWPAEDPNTGGIFTPPDLWAVDLKLDDGKPLSGQFLGFGGPGGSNNCVSADDAYNVGLTTRQCQAAYILD